MKKQKKDIVQGNNLFSNTLKIIKTHLKFFSITLLILLVVYAFLYGLWRIPFIGFGFDRMSEVSSLDYLFLVLSSLLVASLITLIKYERIQKFSSSSKSAAFSGSLAGVVSAICPACQGITFVALGSSIFNIPAGPIIPYLGVIQLVSVGLLFLALFLKSDSIFKNTCITCSIFPAKKIKKSKSQDPFLIKSNIGFAGILIVTSLLIFNQFLIPKAFSFSFGDSVANLGGFQYGSKFTLKPMPLAQGEQPIISGYGSKVKSIPTISDLPQQSSTGDAVQDLLNNLIPKGTPWYGQEAGVSFDDPIAAQKSWKKGLSLQLSTDEESRWNRIVNSFTCDYCCGSPQDPTIITRCGCSHSIGAQGMAKWFVKFYGNKYSDEEIYGEMARWYSLWYPGPTIKRIIQETQN